MRNVATVGIAAVLLVCVVLTLAACSAGHADPYGCQTVITQLTSYAHQMQHTNVLAAIGYNQSMILELRRDIADPHVSNLLAQPELRLAGALQNYSLTGMDTPLKQIHQVCP